MDSIAQISTDSTTNLHTHSFLSCPHSESVPLGIHREVGFTPPNEPPQDYIPQEVLQLEETKDAIAQTVSFTRRRRWELLNVAKDVLRADAGEDEDMWKQVLMCSSFLPNNAPREYNRNDLLEGDEGGHKALDLVFNHETGIGHLSGLNSCRAEKLCPVCAARGAAENRERINAIVTAAHRKGYTVVMATYTLQHKLARPEQTEEQTEEQANNTSLGSLNDGLVKAIRRTKRGKAWMNFKAKYGFIGAVLAYDLKVSFMNGWHPHRHEIMIFDHVLTALEVAEIQRWISARYRKFLEKLGHYANEEHGFLITTNKKKIADYCTKWGLDYELTGAEQKDSDYSYTPFQLLDLVESGGEKSQQAREWFIEYAWATKGMVLLRVPKQLAELVEETPEEEQTEDETQGNVVLVESLDTVETSVVIRARALGELEELVTLSKGNRAQIWAFLEGLGVPRRFSREWVVDHVNYLADKLWSGRAWGWKFYELEQEIRDLIPVAEMHSLKQSVIDVLSGECKRIPDSA